MGKKMFFDLILKTPLLKWRFALLSNSPYRIWKIGECAPIVNNFSSVIIVREETD
jgi:hypothetical protein